MAYFKGHMYVLNPLCRLKVHIFVIITDNKFVAFSLCKIRSSRRRLFLKIQWTDPDIVSCAAPEGRPDALARKFISPRFGKFVREHVQIMSYKFQILFPKLCSVRNCKHYAVWEWGEVGGGRGSLRKTTHKSIHWLRQGRRKVNILCSICEAEFQEKDQHRNGDVLKIWSYKVCPESNETDSRKFV